MGVCRCEFIPIKIIMPKFILLGTGRTRGIGDLVGLLIPIEGIQSQMNHFQKSFFSKRICGQRRMYYMEKNSTSPTSVLRRKLYALARSET